MRHPIRLPVSVVGPTSSSIRRCAANSTISQQIGVGALLQQGAKAHHVIGHRRILGSVEGVPTKPYRRFTMATAVDK